MAIPKLRTWSFVPSILEPRRRIDQALYAVVMEAHVQAVSTRGVDALIAAMGGTGVSESEVSRICADLDEVVDAFRTRALDHGALPHVFLDATYLHVRSEASQVVSKAVVIATRVTATGRREILGLESATGRGVLARLPDRLEEARPGRGSSRSSPTNTPASWPRWTAPSKA